MKIDFDQTWLYHSFLRYSNTERPISPEREGFRGSNFVRFILGIYICFIIGNVNYHNVFECLYETSYEILKHG